MNFDVLRKKMVDEHLAGRGIKNISVLAAFRKVQREKFVPEELKNDAYVDYPIPIGGGQTISQPYIVALMTELLDLNGNERVLEIGTGSGYQTAILAELAKEIYSIERLDNLAVNANKLLKDLGYSNIKMKSGDGTLGWQEEAPFDRIIITAATPRIPLPLTEQLKENGKIVLPLGEKFSQVLTVIEKKNGILNSTEVCGCVFVPLVGKYGMQDR